MAAEKPKPAAQKSGAGRGGRKPIIDDDDEPIGGKQAGYSAAVAYENKSNQPSYDPFGGDKIPTNGIESKPMYATTVLSGP